MKKKIIGAASAFLLWQTGCNVEDYNLSDISTDDLVLNTSVSTPIGQSTISIEDLLKKQDIEGIGYDSEGVVVFTYDTLQHFDIESIKANGFNSTRTLSGYELFQDDIEAIGLTEEEFYLQNKSVNLSLPKSDKIAITGKIAIKDIFDNEQFRIDSIIFKEAPVTVTLSSNITGLLENSTAYFGINEDENPNGFKPTAAQPFHINLKNTMIRIGMQDSVEINGYLTLNKSLNVTIDTKKRLTIKMSANDDSWKFDKAWGIFNGLDPQIGYENIPIELYDQNDQEGVKFNLLVENPQINIKVLSNIGMPFRLGIDKLEAKNNKKTILAKFKDGENKYITDLDYAKHPGDNITVLNEVFDKNNGSIDNLVNILPNEVNLAYQFQGIYTDLNSEKNHFITSDAYIDMVCRVELPAYLRKGSYILVSDTLKDIEIGDDLGEKYTFDKIKLSAMAYNSLPFDAKVNFFFLEEDEESGKISIIPDININKDITVSSGKVDGSTDLVKTATTSIELLEFTAKDIPNLKKAKHLLIMYEVDVNNFDKVKVTRDNKLKIVLKGFAKGSVNIGKLEENEDENN